MIRALAALLLASLTAPAQAQEARFVSLTGLFDEVARATAGLPDAERIARFHAVMDPALPDFYRVPADQAERRAKMLLWQLNDYPAQSNAILAVSATMQRAYINAGKRFRGYFPGYRADIPVYVLHSLSRMDGGTRTIGGRTVLIFGADVIARIHDAASIGPFLDHELFHTHHQKYFKQCKAAWCGLWTEGLATYVAQRLNPGADDRALLLSFPQPIRAKVDARFAEAACMTLAKLDSTAEADIGGFVYGNAPFPGWPPRMGYYLGLRIAEQMGQGASLDALTKMAPAQVRPRVEAALRSMAECPAGGQPRPSAASTLHGPAPAAAR